MTHRAARLRLHVAIVMLGVALGSVSAGALADTAVCTGKITAMSSHAPGGLYLAIEGVNVFKVCDFDASQFNLSPAACKHIAGLAMMAFALEKTVHFYVDNAPTTACSSIPSWHTSNTRYFFVYP